VNKIPVETLLRWRLSRAEAEAPPAPRAARLLELARPWWERWPDRFQSLVERLGRIQIACGHAMTEPRRDGSGLPVPAVIFRTAEDLETSVRVVCFAIRDGRLRLRFQLDGQAHESLDVTFIADPATRPLLSAQATLSPDGEYRIDAELPEELERSWAFVKVTDRMPFRLILRSDTCWRA